MQDLRAQLIMAGLATEEQAKAVEVEVCHSDTPVDVETFNPHVIEAAQGIVNLLSVSGSVQALEAELSAPYGYGRSISAIQGRIDAAKNPAKLEDDDLRVARDSAGYLLGCGRARDFNSRITEIFAAIDSGIISVKKTVAFEVAPEAPSTGDPVADQDAFPTWKENYSRWWQKLTEVQRSRAGVDSPNSSFFEEKQREISQRIIQQEVAEIRRKYDECASFEEAMNVFKKEEGRNWSLATEAMFHSKFAWEVCGIWSSTNNKPKEPLADNVAVKLSSSALANLAAKESLIHGAVHVVRAEARRRWPSEDGCVVVMLNDNQFVRSDGGVVSGNPEFGVPEDLRGKSVSIRPNKDGWLELYAEMKWATPRWLSGKVFDALVLLTGRSAGSVFLMPDFFNQYSRHPEKGYPRFFFEVKAGSGKASLEIPVWRPSSQAEGWLADHLDAMQIVRKAELEIPSSAFWLNVKIGQTKKGSPRLEPVSKDQAQSAALYTMVSSAHSHGRHGWSGDVVGTKKELLAPEVNVLWDRWTSSSGGGVNAQRIVAWIPKGSILPLDNGKGIVFNGEEILEVVGAGLSPEDDPTRD